MSVIDNERIKQVSFLLIIVLLAYVLFSELYTFFPGFLGAITMYILSRKYMFRLVEGRRWRKSLAAALLMFMSFIIILLPFGMLINMLTNKVGYAVTHSSELIGGLKTVNDRIQAATKIDILSQVRLERLQEYITSVLPGLLGATFNILTAIAILYFILYFMLVNGREMEAWLYEYIPLKDENVLRLGTEFHKLVIANAVGIPLIAVIQGIVSLPGYFIFQVPQPFFWFAVTCFTAMLPVVGAAAVYVPMGVYLLAINMTWQGIGVLVYGFAIVGTSDNLFRLILAKKIGDVHPLITVFGVLIGVNLFGFIGLIFGPLLISMFILLLDIYSNEFLTKKREVRIQR
ncbi:AI-2E family transporter [Chitinophaga ginsengisoli]|uniref:Putative PurR-regulated permease PerM n=1 Tax=Chitinophaga ginsengisoli TaxID=363837 RepID=A0A2P8GNP7_9BACT|nr:AI-2E family transporter [Chitinophaga ginsengisoli]PSL35581.1 putative PurR-regulated permease PerM [Chitinophaga ginsengisoli]